MRASASEKERLNPLPTPSAVQHFSDAAGPIWPAWMQAAAVCVWFSWGALPPAYLATWVSVYLVFMFARVRLFRAYLAQPPHERANAEALWQKRFTTMMIAYGTMQVTLIGAAIPFSPIERAFLLTFMIFFSAVIVVSMMPLSKQNLRNYLVLTQGVVAASWLASPLNFGWIVAILLCLSCLPLYKSGMVRLHAVQQAHRLGLQLAESHELLRQAHVTRSRLTMEASHDLRQPVQALTLMAELLRNTQDPVAMHARVRDIELSSASLADMLSELMEFSRLDLGGYAPAQQPVSVEDILRELSVVLGATAHNKQLDWWVAALPLHVHSHPWMLRRILLNLATNALKYTQEGSVSIECRRGEGFVDIVVSDTGPGIAEAHHGRIFMEYVRIDETRGSEPGMGIGLAFAKRAADALGHTLTVQSSVGKGTRMTLRAQLVAPAATGAPLSPIDAPNERNSALVGLHALVIENDAMLRRSLVSVLQSWGMTVNAVASAEQWSEIPVTTQLAPAMILADLHLDGKLNGLQAIAQVRERFRSSRLPALLLTGDLSQEIETEAASQHVTLGYKPVRPQRLREVLLDLAQDGMDAAADAAPRDDVRPAMMGEATSTLA